MKKLFFTTLFSLCCVMALAQYITIKGKQLYDQSGNPFFVKGVNYGVDLFNASGDTAHLELRRHHGYYYDSNYPAYGTSSQHFTDIKNDFKFIHDSLGCNTIRLRVGNGGLDGCVNNRFSVSIAGNTNDVYGDTKTIYCTSLQFLTPFYDSLLDAAATYSLNVVLLLYGSNTTCNPNTSLYINYIAYTANALKTKTALLAYDECNEPQFNNGYPNSRSTVCTLSYDWYTAIKANDPNHLVTVGLWEGGFGTDASTWSTDVYSADFYAFHVYADRQTHSHQAFDYDYYAEDPPGSGIWVHDTAWKTVLDTNYIYDNVTLYKQKYNTTVKWLSSTTDKAWLIGEMGFTANLHRNDVSNLADGSTSSQTDFLQNAYTVNIQAGGMGTLWWDYHDVAWMVPSAPGDAYFGLVDSLGAIKPAGTALKNFNSSTVTGAPPDYPSNFQNLNGNGGTTITGAVTGAKNAIVNGWHTQLNLVTNKVESQYAGVVPTDASGNFSITSKTSPNPHILSLTAINQLQISAVGYNVVTCDGYTNPADLYNGKSFSLTGRDNYNRTEPGMHFAADLLYGVVAELGVYTLQDFYIKPLASPPSAIYTTTITATGEIAILPQGTTDSYIVEGAEADLYINSGFVLLDCSSATWDNYTAERQANTSGGKAPVKIDDMATLTTQPTINAKTVYLSPESFLLQVYPNPANDKVLVQSAKNINLVTVCSMYGNVVSQYNLQGANQQQIDVSQFAPGSYTIKILYSDNTTSITQIIKQ